MNQGNSLFLFFNLVKKGDLSSAFLVLQIFFLYKYALVRRELLFLLKKKKEIVIDNYLLKVDRFDKGISKDLLVCKKREHLSFEFVKIAWVTTRLLSISEQISDITRYWSRKQQKKEKFMLSSR